MDDRAKAEDRLRPVRQKADNRHKTKKAAKYNLLSRESQPKDKNNTPCKIEVAQPF